ncbi:MAG: Single-stranded DNA-binding protein [Candidatus Woesebacteria bacterium GW2011_GWA1_37_7]|uniref:Single-stranded DNA-binding protein n=1 Tax=Candidatus Woesebacteria bacterium GW2011_GWA1_37_7 TaxID=1618545 RepID=A0A0G0HE85_9BACT|nr:MAG: Single-stranded DNA-binding protein [Candidatus Woesebacteria bacterium GW2011_GWA1_37_7]
MSRSLNKAVLIGNLTRDPELRYTPSGTAVCTFGLATNRQWTTDSGEKREDVEFHRIVAWNKLAELCAQLLNKGRKVYVEGRLQTRRWTAQDGTERSTTEVVISDMIILDSRTAAASGEDFDVPEDFSEDTTLAPADDKGGVKGEKEEKLDTKDLKTKKPLEKKVTKAEGKDKDKESDENDDIPF